MVEKTRLLCSINYINENIDVGLALSKIAYAQMHVPINALNETCTWFLMGEIRSSFNVERESCISMISQNKGYLMLDISLPNPSIVLFELLEGIKLALIFEMIGTVGRIVRRIA